LCSNVVKICPTENREIVRYLIVRKKQFRLPLKRLRLRGSRQKFARAISNNVLTVLQISSKLVHFPRSYSRTSEHHFSDP